MRCSPLKTGNRQKQQIVSPTAQRPPPPAITKERFMWLFRSPRQALSFHVCVCGHQHLLWHLKSWTSCIFRLICVLGGRRALAVIATRESKNARRCATFNEFAWTPYFHSLYFLCRWRLSAALISARAARAMFLRAKMVNSVSRSSFQVTEVLLLDEIEEKNSKSVTNSSF